MYNLCLSLDGKFSNKFQSKYDQCSEDFSTNYDDFSSVKISRTLHLVRPPPRLQHEPARPSTQPEAEMEPGHGHRVQAGGQFFRQKETIKNKSVSQAIVIYYLTVLCKLLWSGLKYTKANYPLVVYMSLSSSFDIPGSPRNVSSGFSDVSGINTSFGGSFEDPWQEVWKCN